MGSYKRYSLIFVTTAFLLLTLVEALVYFKLVYFNPNDMEAYVCRKLGIPPTEILLSIGGLGVLYGTLYFRIRRTIFWGLLLGFIGNVFGLILLWWGIVHFIPSFDNGSICPSNLSLLISEILSYILLTTCSWVVSCLIGAFLGNYSSK